MVWEIIAVGPLEIETVKLEIKLEVRQLSIILF